MKEISEKEFEAEVLKSKEPVLVDFYAIWCAPCRALEPIIKEISAKGIKVVKVNVDKCQKIASAYSIFSIPTLTIFSEGKVKSTMVGFSGKEKILEWIERNKQ